MNEPSKPNGSGGSDSARALELRRAFDASFALPARGRVADVERLLLLHFGGDGYAFRLAEIGGLSAARKIVPIASAVAEVLGLAGVRGNLVPVYSLSALLGYGIEAEAPRWFVGCRDPEPIALGFAGFDGYAELEMTALHAATPNATPHAHVQALVRTRAVEGQMIAVLDVASLVTAIKERSGSPGAFQAKEQ
jgi:chemotaxis signal transduction protein